MIENIYSVNAIIEQIAKVLNVCAEALFEVLVLKHN